MVITHFYRVDFPSNHPNEKSNEQHMNSSYHIPISEIHMYQIIFPILPHVWKSPSRDVPPKSKLGADNHGNIQRISWWNDLLLRLLSSKLT